jgi:hypothetical protein
MLAVSKGLKYFKVDVSVADDLAAAKEYDYEDIVALKDMNISTEYFLFADDNIRYHTLDAPETMNNILEVTDAHIIHCTHEAERQQQQQQHALIKEGDFIVGTSTGHWRHSQSLHKTSSVITKHTAGLIYTRKAVSHEPYDAAHLLGINHKGPLEQTPGAASSTATLQNCVKVSTEHVHPFELIDHFHMVSTAYVPYIMDSFDLENPYNPDASDGAEEGVGAGAGATKQTESAPVDPPAQSCQSASNQYFSGSGSFSPYNPNDDYAVVAGWTVGKGENIFIFYFQVFFCFNVKFYNKRRLCVSQQGVSLLLGFHMELQSANKCCE